MYSHYNYNDKNIQATTITIFLIPSQSDFLEAWTMIKHFQPIKMKFKGKGRALHLFTHTSRSNGAARRRANSRSAEKPGTFWQRPFLLQKCCHACRHVICFFRKPVNQKQIGKIIFLHFLREISAEWKIFCSECLSNGISLQLSL